MEAEKVTVRLSSTLFRKVSEHSRSLGMGEEECLEKLLLEALSGTDSSSALTSEIRRFSESTDRSFRELRENLQEINEKNRNAYESLVGTLKPSRREWGLIAGVGSLLAVLVVVAVAGFGQKTGEIRSSGETDRKEGLSIPSQMGQKERYAYFVGQWYLGIRDRMSTKERLYLENYLKPFDNFDEDLKYKKKAGL